MSFFTCCGTSNSEQSIRVSDDYNSIIDTEPVSDTEFISDTDEISDLENDIINESCKPFYSEKLMNILNSGTLFTEFKIVYINDDDIPEVILSGSSQKTSQLLLAIVNNEVREIFNDGIFYISYKEGFAVSENAGENYNHLAVYDMNTDTITTLNMNEDNTFDKNGESITAEEYKRLYAQYCSQAYYADYDVYSLTADNIISVFGNYVPDTESCTETEITDIAVVSDISEILNTDVTEAPAETSVETTTLTGTVHVPEEYLNVRSQPTTQSELIGQIKNNDTVVILEQCDKWYKIEYNGSEAYVFGEYIKF
jgi:hypothetical protein